MLENWRTNSFRNTFPKSLTLWCQGKVRGCWNDIKTGTYLGFLSLLPREAEQNGVCGKRNDQKKEPWRASLGEIICELSKGRWGKWVELMKKENWYNFYQSNLSCLLKHRMCSVFAQLYSFTLCICHLKTVPLWKLQPRHVSHTTASHVLHTLSLCQRNLLLKTCIFTAWFPYKHNFIIRLTMRKNQRSPHRKDASADSDVNSAGSQRKAVLWEGHSIIAHCTVSGTFLLSV